MPVTATRAVVVCCCSFSCSIQPLHRNACMLQLKRQQHTKDGKTVTHQDHFRCAITCSYCGKRRHYEDECHIKNVRVTNTNGSRLTPEGPITLQNFPEWG